MTHFTARATCVQEQSHAVTVETLDCEQTAHGPRSWDEAASRLHLQGTVSMPAL